MACIYRLHAPLAQILQEVLAASKSYPILGTIFTRRFHTNLPIALLALGPVSPRVLLRPPPSLDERLDLERPPVY